jgi:hypothetical protein
MSSQLESAPWMDQSRCHGTETRCHEKYTTHVIGEWREAKAMGLVIAKFVTMTYNTRSSLLTAKPAQDQLVETPKTITHGRSETMILIAAAFL